MPKRLPLPLLGPPNIPVLVVLAALPKRPGLVVLILLLANMGWILRIIKLSRSYLQ